MPRFCVAFIDAKDDVVTVELNAKNDDEATWNACNTLEEQFGPSTWDDYMHVYTEPVTVN